MAEVVRVNATMFGQIYDLLRELNPLLSQEQWAPLFYYSWEREEDYTGFALVDQERIVGYLGCLFSKRLINGQWEKFCNLTSWIVKEEYRSESLSLVFPILQLKDYTITNLSPSTEAYAIFKKFGFQDLEQRIIFLPFLPSLKLIFPGKKVSITDDLEAIKEKLTQNDRQVLLDHLPYQNCEHHLLVDGDDYCYIMTREAAKGRWFWFTQIYHFSNPSLFWKHFERIQGYFFLRNRTLMTMFEERLVNFQRVPQLYYALPTPRLFKSKRCRKEDIDYLYTEKILLNR